MTFRTIKEEDYPVDTFEKLLKVVAESDAKHVNYAKLRSMSKEELIDLMPYIYNVGTGHGYHCSPVTYLHDRELILEEAFRDQEREREEDNQ